jgi:hypothetical protein
MSYQLPRPSAKKGNQTHLIAVKAFPGFGDNFTRHASQVRPLDMVCVKKLAQIIVAPTFCVVSPSFLQNYYRRRLVPSDRKHDIMCFFEWL